MNDFQPQSSTTSMSFGGLSLITVRSILFALYLIVFTPPYAVACFIAFPFIKLDNRYWMAIRWCRITVGVARTLAGIRHRVIGRENLPEGPAVVLSKHQSAWETIALPTLMPRPMCYVFKRELLYVPFFGWALGLLSMVHIDRKRGPRAFNSVVEQGQRRLEQGAWVIMFPEGTRTPSGSKGRYKTGGARFATATGAPVIPVAHNAGRVWPKNSFFKFPGIVTVSIGPPIASAGLTPEQLNSRVEAWIEAEMRRIDPTAYQADAPPTDAVRERAL